MAGTPETMVAAADPAAPADRAAPNGPRPVRKLNGDRPRAGRWLSALGLVPALLATSWVVAAFPLAWAGQFRPELVVPLAVVVAVVLVPLGLSLLRADAVTRSAPVWSVLACVAVAVGFVVFTALTHDEHVIPRRDGGSYIQIAYWLAHRHTLVAPVPTAAFGPDPGAIGFASPAFYQPGASVVPQFMTGWPALLAGAGWIGGWTGMLLTPAVVGGLAILAVAGLAARLVGPRWAPLVAALVAVAWPTLRSAQETLSEPLAMLMLAGGTCLLVDLVTATGADVAVDRRRIRRVGFAAGLVLAGGELVRLDFGVDFALLVPVIGWLWLNRRPGVVPFVAGAALGGVLGVLDGAFVTRPYIQNNIGSVKLMIALLGASVVVTVLAVAVLRRMRRGPRQLRWWRVVPVIGAGAVALVAVGLLLRPYLLIDHSTTDHGVFTYTEVMQRALGLPLDGSRGYAEQSLWWVSWYLGWPLLAAALVGAVLLVRGALAGRDRAWLPMLLVYLGSAILVLVRPGITPDHPWADRRLVVEVLPVMILLAVWVTATLVRRVRTRLLAGGVLVVAVGAFGLPAVLATAPVATQRTEVGEPGAIDAVCSVLRPTDSVVVIDQLWMPVIRGQCGLPVAQLLAPSPQAVARAVASIKAAGRTPVIAGSQLDSPAPLNLLGSTAVNLNTRQDERELLQRPDGTDALLIQFWYQRI